MKRGLLATGAALLLCALAYAAVALLARSFLDPQALAGIVQARASATLGRDVAIEGAGLHLFPGLGADLTGVSVDNPPGFPGPPLARIRTVRLRVAILPLLRGHVRVDQVQVEGPDLRLSVDSTGRSNYEGLTGGGEGVPPAPARVSVAVRNVSLRDGHVSWERPSDSLRTGLTGLSADLSLDAAGDGTWRGRLHVSADTLAVSAPVLSRGQTRVAAPVLDARGTASSDRVVVDEGTLTLGDARATLSGSASGLRSDERRVEWTLRAADLGLDSLSAEVETAPGRITVRRFAGTALGGPFSVDGVLRTDSTRELDARLTARPELDRFAGVASLPDSVSLAGRLDAQVRITGTLQHPGEARMDGAVTAAGVRITHPRLGVPVTVKQGRLELQGRSAAWKALTVGFGGDRVTTTGTLDDPVGLLIADAGRLPRLDAELHSARLELDSILPPSSDPSVTYGKIAFARLGGRKIGGRSAEEWADAKGFALPDSLPLKGELRVRVDTLVSAPYRLTGLDARVALSPGLVQLPSVTFRAFGGDLRSSLRLGIGGGGPRPFDLSLDVEGMRGADFLAAATPLGRTLRGTLSTQLQAKGEVDARLLPLDSSLAGSGRIHLQDGGLSETPVTRTLADALSLPGLAAPAFQEWTAPFRIEGGTLRFQDASIATTLGTLSYSGRTGLDGSLDLGVTLDVPAGALDSLSLGRSGALRGLVGRITGGAPVALGLALTGTVKDPRIRPDSSLVSGNLRKRLEAAGTTGVRSRVESGARKLLKGLLGQGDSAGTPASPDSTH